MYVSTYKGGVPSYYITQFMYVYNYMRKTRSFMELLKWNLFSYEC